MTYFLMLSFASRATLDDESRDLPLLVLQSAAKNHRLGVTGALLFDGVSFLEVLEGDPAAVRRLMGAIYRDDRHTDISGAVSFVAPERRYSKWTMSRIDGPEQAPMLDRDRIARMGLPERVRLMERFLGA